MNNDNLDITIFNEIKDYREKFWGVTFRQIVFGLITLSIVVPLYFYARKYIGEDMTQFLVIIVSAPILFIGFVPVQGLDAEKILPYWKRQYINFFNPMIYMTDKEVIAEKNEKSLKYMYLDDGSVRPLTKIEKKERKKKIKQAKIQQKKLSKELKKKTRKKDIKSSKQEKMVVLPSDEKLSKKELRKLKKQEKELAKAKKKFGIKDKTTKPIQSLKDNDKLVVEKTKSEIAKKLEDREESKIDLTVGTISKQNKPMKENISIEENELKEPIKEEIEIDDIMEKYELYESFKKRKPNATQEDFEVFYNLYKGKKG